LGRSIFIYKKGTFFADQMERLCSRWNGSYFAWIFLLFDYAMGYRFYATFIDTGTAYESVNYMLVLMLAFWALQIHYAYDALWNIRLYTSSDQKPCDYAVKLTLDVCLSLIYPLVFIVFYPLMWIYRRLLSKKGLFGSFRCARAIRVFLFPHTRTSEKGALGRGASTYKKGLDGNDEAWWSRLKRRRCCCCFFGSKRRSIEKRTNGNYEDDVGRYLGASVVTEQKKDVRRRIESDNSSSDSDDSSRSDDEANRLTLNAFTSV
jgi:hypothetical protein